MKFGIYSIRDSATDVYAPPFVSHNNNTAMRSFGDLANDPQSSIKKHPSDYALIRVGTWDDDEGRVTPEEHTTLAWAGDFINEPPST